MNFTLLALDTETGQTETVALALKAEDVQMIRRQLADRPSAPKISNSVVPGKSGRPGRKVVVTESTVADVPAGTVFPSCLDASIALGFGFNALTQKFTVAQKVGETAVTLRGVTFEKQ